jgi:LDH2 family malate/lactate/ureidoglycolate dehydrogenase
MRRLRMLTGAVRGAERAAGTAPFQIPGEREAATRRERSRGIPIAPSQLAVLTGLGERFGVPLPAGRAAERRQ